MRVSNVVAVREGGGLDLAFESAGVAMAELALDGIVVRVNHAFEELLGRTQDSLLGTPLLDLVVEQDAAAVRGGRLTRFRSGTIRADLRFIRAGGGLVSTRVAISLARDTDGSPAFLLATMQDVGDLKTSEANLRREALYDPETDMPTHRLFEDRLSVALRAAQRDQEPVLVGVVRLRPDADIIVAAERLAGTVREGDSVARLGRLEFGVLMPGGTADAFTRCLPDGVVAAAGAASFPEDGDDPGALLAAAQLLATPRAAAAAETETEDTSEDAAARVRALEPVSLFLAVPDQVLRRIARYTSRQTARAGDEVMLAPGAPALHIVEEGLFEVIPEGHESGIMTLAPSDFIAGDHGAEGPLTLRLRALTDTKLLVLEREALDQVAPPGSHLHASIGDALQQRAHQLRRLAERSGRSVDATQLTAIYSPKGGAGRTTIALNLASELAARHPGEVLLVDLSLPFNHAALLANLVPATCLARLGGIDRWALPGALRGALIGHPDGFMVLPTALRPEEAELLSTDLVTAAIDDLSPHFRHVIFDLGVALSDEVIAVIERAHRVLLVATPELATMHDMRYLIDLATRVLQVPSSALELVLNHRTPHSPMDVHGVEKVLGRRVTAEFRYLGGRPESAGLAGTLLARTQPTPFAKAMRDLADRISAASVTRTA